MDLTKINQQNLKEPKTLDFIKKEVQRIVFHLEDKEAFKLLRHLQKLLSQEKFESQNQNYSPVLVKLKFVCLPRLQDKEFLDLIKNNYLDIFDTDIDLQERLKIKLLSFDNDFRDEFKKSILNALRNNQQKITSNTLDIGGRRATPIISEWLKKYDQGLGSGKVNDIKLNDYLLNDKDVKQLSPEEKDKISKLFHFYEKLKISSTAMEGFEDDILILDNDNNFKVLAEGRLTPISSLLKRASMNLREEGITFKTSTPSATESGIKTSKISFQTNYNQTLQQIITQSNLHLPDQNLTSRFRNIILSRLRNIRTTITTREVLMRSPKIGGLGLDEAQADKILKIIETQAKNIHESKQVLDSEQKPQGLLDKAIASSYSLEKSIQQGRNNIQKAGLKSQPTPKPKPDLAPSHEIKPPKKIAKIEFTRRSPGRNRDEGGPPAPSHISGPKPIKPSQPKRPPVKIQEIKPPVKKPIFAEPKIKKPVPIPTPKAPTKPQVESIKPRPPRITGEVEEIGNLKLADFRRWSTDPEEAAARIQDKIEQVEKESVEKKAAAIRAWQNSEINRLYLAIGEASMSQDKAVEQIIKERQAENKPSLTPVEFDAVADLNEELRF